MEKPKPSDWRHIQQQLVGEPVTPIAQKRRRFVLQKKVVSIIVIVTLVLGFSLTAYFISYNSKTFAPYAEEQGHTKVIFFSDGQLDEAWFNEQFISIKEKGLLSIDITGMQATLLKNPQILQANVERHFPNTLKVTLTERTPIGRIKLKLDGKVDTYYIARDGALFTSATYKPQANLPFLYGIAIHQTDSGIAPITGMIALGELLDGFKTLFPDLYVQIAKIDLTDWKFPVNQQTSVVLQTRTGARLRFSAENISTQLSRLKQTLDLMATEKQTLGNKLVDLTYPDKVSVVGGKK